MTGSHVRRIHALSIAIVALALVALGGSRLHAQTCCTMKFQNNTTCGFIFRVTMTNSTVIGGTSPSGPFTQPFDCVFGIPTVATVELLDGCGNYIMIPANGCAYKIRHSIACCVDACWSLDTTGCIVITIDYSADPCEDCGPARR